MNNYVLYHASCFDGTGAKYAAWKHFGDKATYIPVQYGKPFPEEVPLGKETYVYILDFSYPKAVLEKLNDNVALLVVLDHHKTAQADLEGLEYAHFDMSKSGAVIAWEYFHKDKPVPTLLKYVQDGDLWKFELEFTKEVRAALPILEDNMELWDGIANDDTALQSLCVVGGGYIRKDALKIKSVLKKDICILPYKGYKAAVYNTTVLVSEIGSAVYNSEELGVDFSMSYFISEKGEVVFSFRSKGDMDVSVLAKELGGGGHKNAAGAGRVTLGFLQDLYSGKL